MLIATGLSADDLNKPQVGIGAVWYEGNPCNMHLHDLGGYVKEGVAASNCVGMRFNTIGVSDGISMGTDGMSYSLQSRDLIADSIETIMGAQFYDALVTIPGCDKNMPGCIMAMARLNRPSLMIYGGTIRAGCTKFRGEDKKLDIVNTLEAYGQLIAGKITEASARHRPERLPRRRRVRRDVHRQHDGLVHRVHGLSLPYSASIPAEDPARSRVQDGRRDDAHAARADLKPRDIVTSRVSSTRCG
jgi:dihydroxy-acid dehydratase